MSHVQPGRCLVVPKPLHHLQKALNQNSYTNLHHTHTRFAQICADAYLNIILDHLGSSWIFVSICT